MKLLGRTDQAMHLAGLDEVVVSSAVEAVESMKVLKSSLDVAVKSMEDLNGFVNNIHLFFSQQLSRVTFDFLKSFFSFYKKKKRKNKSCFDFTARLV